MSVEVSTGARAVRSDPAYQAFLLLRRVFTVGVAPVLFGLDKCTNLLTNWPRYLASWLHANVPGTAAGDVRNRGRRVLAGIAVAVIPRFGGWLAAAWLMGIIINLLAFPGFFDVALGSSGCSWPRGRWRGWPPATLPAATPVPTRCHELRRDQRGAPRQIGEPRRGGPAGHPTPGEGGPARRCAGGERPARRAGQGADRGEPVRHTGRVARAYAELLAPRAFTLTTFSNDEGYDELVLARDIPVQSLCEHHLLPFHGVAHIGYLPGARIVGLSKLARIVQHFARDLQVQKRLTPQVADRLQQDLNPKGVRVVIEAEHLCMSLRGARATGARTVTSALHGALREDARSRQEFFALTASGPDLASQRNPSRTLGDTAGLFSRYRPV